MGIRFIAAVLSVAFFSLAPHFARADDPASTLTPINAYRTLTWADYPVNDRAPGLSAQTRTFLRYTLRAAVNGRNGAYTARVESLQFTGGMDRAGSWRRSSVPTDAVQLLQHEQGHLAINELRRRQLQATPLSTFPAGQGSTARAAYENLVLRLRHWYQIQLNDLTSEQNRYDKETAFGTRVQAQADWSARLNAALEKPPHFL